MSLKKPNNHADVMGSLPAAKTTGDMRQLAANAMLEFARKEISSTEMNAVTKKLNAVTKKLNAVTKKLNSSLKRNPTRTASTVASSRRLKD